MTDTTVPDLDSIESAPADKEYVITGQSGAEQYTLKIDGIAATDERDSNNPSNPENVVVIDYTYKNNAQEALLVDDMSFKLVVGDTVCTPYYSGSLDSAELINEGESCSAQMAFEVGKDFREGSLVYTDAQTQEEIQFDVKLKIGKHRTVERRRNQSSAFHCFITFSAGPAVSLWINFVPTVTFNISCRSCPSIICSRSTASSPIRSRSAWIVVRPGTIISQIPELSNPITEISWGTRYPKR